MTTVLPRNVGGRPPAVIDLLTVERAAAIGCPVEDIAALLGIGRRTLYDHMERDPAVADAIEKGRGTGRATLRRMQWEKAQAGDTSMLIWLGKVMCGQRETSVVAMTGPNGGPVQSERVTVSVDPIEAARVYQNVWGDHDPRAYLGITVPGFPNLFLTYGPNTDLAHGGSIARRYVECSGTRSRPLARRLSRRLSRGPLRRSFLLGGWFLLVDLP